MNLIAVGDEQPGLRSIEHAVSGAAPGELLMTFSTGREALSYAREHRVDVAFLDIPLRGTTGLELAKELMKLHPRINIIFVSAYSEYLSDAFSLYASGYVRKPVRMERVRNELANLRYPILENPARVRIQTFGKFEIFVEGAPLTFRRSKSKELLAYLVDRQGASSSRKELAAVLWEEGEYTRAKQAYLQAIIEELLRSLTHAKAENILRRGHNAFSINMAKVDCDLYRFLKGDPDAIASYRGEYLTGYSWSEMTTASLSRQRM